MRTLVLLSFLVCTPALAQPGGEAAARFEKGKAAYRLGEFDDAIAEFREAYRLKADPAFLYNIALSFRGKEDFAQAIFFYQSYLREAPDAANRAIVEAKIAELERVLAERKRVVESPPRTPLPPNEPAPVRHRMEHKPRLGLLLAGGGAGVGGVALVVTGIVFSSRARATAARIDDAAAAHDPWSAELASADGSARRQATAGVVCLGLGAAAIAVGGVLAYLGIRGRLVPIESGVAVAGSF